MSGKVARRMRKGQISKTLSKAISKKTLALCAGLCLSYAPMVAENEFLVSLFPHFSKPFGEAHQMKYGIGAGLRATYRPVKFLNIYAQGDYLSMAMPGIGPVNILNGSLGGGYHLDINDRMAIDLNLNVGLYNAKSSSSVSGISAGGGLIFSYKINPVISVDVGADASHYAAKSKPLMMMNATVSPGVTFNITEIFNSFAKVEMRSSALSPVFPVLYSWYENNSFGRVDITNKEDADITDITVSFYQPQYMAHAKECATIRKIGKNETVGVDLIAFFNEQMLELTEKADTNSYVIVNYSCLGQKRSKTFSMDVPVYGRNNMSWDDDRRAAVFVSSKDPAAMQFAKYTASIVRDNLRIDVPVNIQYALGIFEALNQFGINYVVDPASAFEDNVGTSSIDFLQFPYQTLMYRGGDCDDLSILYCSLFEAVGIPTAFITIPGHIYMAFDSGMTKEQAEETLDSLDDVIIIRGEAWVPLEITLTDEGFYKAHRVGAREWRVAKAQGKAELYQMQDSWRIYQPISVPGASANIHLPDSNAIYLAFDKSVNEWSRGELKAAFAVDRPLYVEKISPVEERLTLMDTKSPYEKDAVLREDLFADPSLLDVLALASNVVAVVPVPEIKEEDLEVFEDEEDEEDNPDKEPDAQSDALASDKEELAEVIPEPLPVLIDFDYDLPGLDLAIFEAEKKAGEEVQPADETDLSPEKDIEEEVLPPVQEQTVQTDVIQQVEKPQDKKKSPLAKILISIGALFAAAAGLIIFARKRKGNR